MKISEIINTYHISRKALLVYEDKGLLTPKRNISGYRVYDEKDITRLKQIIILRRLNFSLEEIENILAGKPWLENKKKEYELEINLLNVKKQYLEKVFYSIKCEADLDYMINVLNQQLDLKNSQDIIPFSLNTDGILILWFACLCFSFYIFQLYVVISSFILGISLLLISLKDKSAYHKSIPFLIVMLAFIQLLIMYNKEINILNIFFITYAFSLIFYGLSLIPFIKYYLLKHKKIISWFFILSGLIMFIVKQIFNYSAYINSMCLILYIFGLYLHRYKE